MSATAEKKTATLTEYVILEQTGSVQHAPSLGDDADVVDLSPKVWRQVGFKKARSAREAIRTFTNEEGVYLAIPARSFQPVTVKVETQTRITLT